MRTDIILAALLAAGPASLAQNIVVNGGFELPVITGVWTQRTPGQTFGSWTVDNTGQGIVVVGSFGLPHAIEGNQCVELNFYQACGISQTLATTPGAGYRLMFMMAGQYDVGPNVKHMRIDWDGVEVDTATWDRAATGGSWQPHTYNNLHATGTSTTLHFFGLENVDGGPYIDSVSVIPVCGPADLGSTGGVHQPDGLLDNNDFIAFIDYFFAADPVADFGSQGGVAPGDGHFDNNDFVVYIDLFFSGCN